MPQRESQSKPDDFARRLMVAMRAVAREVGVESAYPDTREGKIAALKARLKTIESSAEWGSDFQRTLVLWEIRQLRQDHGRP